MLLTLCRLGLSPVSLFLIGTLAAASPFLYTNYEFFNSYPEYETSYGWLIVYVVGVLAFALGALLPSFKFSHSNQEYLIALKPRINFFAYSALIFIQIVLIFLSIRIFNGVPLTQLLFQSLSVNEINEMQQSSGGVLGLLLIFQFIMIAYIPIMIANRNQISKLYRFFFYCLFFFGLIFTGKRQMLFYSFFYLIGFYFINYIRTQDSRSLKKFFKKAIYGFFSIILIFFLIANIRTGESNGIFYSVAHYLSLPFINNMHMYNLYGIEHTRDIFSIFEVAIPTSIRNILSIAPVVTQPQLELTISGGLYGRVFWAYGITGVIVYCFCLGFVLQTLYRFAFRLKFFCFIYPLCVWPTLMVSTYDHFVNMMFFILPITSFLILRLIYTKFRKI